METIRTYLENMFKSLPNTEEVNKIKEDLYSNMEDKYNELKGMGKSENEAIGIVISEFGNIDEITEELGINSNNDFTVCKKESNFKKVSLKEAKDFIDSKKRCGAIVALGVFLCIIAVSSLVFTSSFNKDFAIIPCLIVVACAVGLFIYSGSILNKYESLKKEVFELMPDAESFIQNYSKEFQGKYTISLIIGVILCILAVIPVVVFSESNSFMQNTSVSALLLIVSIAVFIFVYFGNIESSIKQLLQEDDYTPSRKENDKVIGIVASVVFPISSLVYFAISMITGDWHITWIIWPAVGILFGIFSSVYSSIHHKNDGEWM